MARLQEAYPIEVKLTHFPLHPEIPPEGLDAGVYFGGEAIHDALFRACFVDVRNLADVGALVDVAGQVGLDREGARLSLAERPFQAAVEADWQRAFDLGITAVPAFVVGNTGMVGAGRMPIWRNW